MKNLTLSIILPYYKEPQQALFQAIVSVATQVGVDFGDVELVLVCDGGRGVNEEFAGSFAPLEVRRIELAENRGPGVARQAGLDAARGEYAMFIDADDALHNALVIHKFMHIIKEKSPELICAPIVMQRCCAVNFTFERQSMLQVMHGKVYRRDFLSDYKIRFHENLRIYEDSYFNGLVLAFAKNVEHTQHVAYVRKYRPDSLTKADDRAYFFAMMLQYIDSAGCLLDALSLRNAEKLREMAVIFITFFYFTFQKSEWRAPENVVMLANAERRFSERIAPYVPLFYESPELAAAAFSRERSASFAGEIEAETLGEWLGRVLGK